MFVNNEHLLFSGGFKIWECTYDLLHYLIDNNIDLRNKTILDLGCGVGILGMYALQNGATVHFQDYVSISISNRRNI